MENLLKFSCAVLTFFSVVIVLSSPLRFIIGLEFATLVFILLEILLNGFTKQIKISFFKQSDNKIISIFLLSIVYFLSIYVFLSFSFSPVLQSDWNSLTSMQWLSLSLGLIQTYLVPGYLILKLFKIDVSITATLVFSYLFSIFITGFFGFVILSLNLHFQISEILLMVLNGVLLLLNFLRLAFSKNRHVEVQNRNITLNINFLALVALILVILIAISLDLGLHITHEPFIRGDVWRYFGRSMSFLRDTISQTSGIRYYSPVMNYPYWYMLSIIPFLRGVDFPLVNAVILLSVFSFMLPLSFYLFSKKFWKNQRKHVITSTVLFSSFSGLSWLWFLSDKLNNLGFLQMDVNWDALHEIVWFGGRNVLFDFWYPLSKTAEGTILLYGLSLTCIFLILSLVLDDQLSEKVKICSFVLLFSLSYLLHIEEALYFILIFIPAYVLSINPNRFRNAKIVIFSFLVGILLVVLLDQFMPLQFYSVNYLPLAFIISLGVSILFLGMRIKIGTFFVKKLEAFSNVSIWHIFVFLTIYFYGLAWITLFEYGFSVNFDLVNMFWEYGVFPWYYYPLRLGVVGFLTVFYLYLSLTKIRVKWGFRTRFIAISTLLIILLGLVISYFNVNTSLSFMRLNEPRLIHRFLAIPLIFISTDLLIRVSEAFHKKTITINWSKTIKKQVRSDYFIIGLLTMLIIFGSIGSLLKIDAWSVMVGPYGENTPITSSDKEAVNFLISNASIDLRAVTGTLFSENVVYLSGQQVASTESFRYRYPFLSITQPDLAYVLSSDVGYIYINERDDIFINSSVLGRFFKNHLPICYENPETKIFEVPFFTPTDDQSKVNFVLEDNFNEHDISILTAIALTNSSYNIIKPYDYKILQSDILVLSDDPNEPLKLDYDETPDYWVPVGYGSGFGNLSIPIIDVFPQNGSNSMSTVKINVNNNGSYGDWGLVHKFSNLEDWSLFDTLSFNWYGCNTGTRISFVIWTGANNENAKVYHWIDNWEGWKRVSFRINDPSDVIGFPDLTQVSSIRFQTISYNNISGIWFMDNIRLAHGEYSELLDCMSVETILNWVNDGGELVMFNSNGGGNFSDLLNITFSEAIPVNGVKMLGDNIDFPEGIEICQVHADISDPKDVLASYSFNGQANSPMAFNIKIGAGKIVYVYYKPMLDLMSQTSDNNMRFDMLTASGSLIKNVLSLNLTFPSLNRQSTNNRWETLFDFRGSNEITANGLVSIYPKSISIESLRFLEEIDLILETNATYEKFSKITLGSINAQNINITLFTSNASILPNGAGKYMQVLVHGYNISCSLQNAKLELIKNGTLTELNVSNGTIVMHSQSSKIFSLRQPRFVINGKTIFKEAEIGVNAPITVITQQNPIEYDGKLEFFASYCDEDFLLGDDFNFIGSTQSIASSVDYNEWAVPWISILKSPLHMMLLLFITSLIVIILIDNRQKTNISEEKTNAI